MMRMRGQGDRDAGGAGDGDGVGVVADVFEVAIDHRRPERSLATCVSAAGAGRACGTRTVERSG